MNELQTVYLSKLEKMLSVEDTIIARLPDMIESASSKTLSDGLSDHLDETREHRERLMKVFAFNDYTPQAGEDEAFTMMVDTASAEIGDIENDSVRDALIIAAAQSVEHYEIANYGTLVAWADALDKPDESEILQDTLNEEEAADEKLTAIAEGGLLSEGVNETATDDENEDGEGIEDEDEETAGDMEE